jgi:tripartite-type tricarboxylate transporter receptor subunit TctC
LNQHQRLGIVLTSIVLAALALPVSAQNYPSKSISLIVPWTAGGPTDVALRALADSASKQLGQPIVIENKAGGAGTVGPATMALTAKPDGYTISQLPVGIYRQPLMQKTSWKLEDFTFIASISGYVFGMASSATAPFKTWDELLVYAKANPGKVTYGTPGAGSTQHLGVSMITEKAGIKLTHVPFKGASEVYAAAAGGHVMVAVSGIPEELVQSGKLRMLNTWSEKRSARAPDTPTLLELGYPFVITAPWGIGGPKGMDPKVVATLSEAFRKALADPAVVATMDRFEMKPAFRPQDEYMAYVQEQIKVEEAALALTNLVKKP